MNRIKSTAGAVLALGLLVGVPHQAAATGGINRLTSDGNLRPAAVTDGPTLHHRDPVVKIVGRPAHLTDKALALLPPGLRAAAKNAPINGTTASDKLIPSALRGRDSKASPAVYNDDNRTAAFGSCPSTLPSDYYYKF